jgi:hypothetical protein
LLLFFTPANVRALLLSEIGFILGLFSIFGDLPFPDDVILFLGVPLTRFIDKWGIDGTPRVGNDT